MYISLACFCKEFCYLPAQSCERQTLFGYHGGDNYYQSKTADLQQECLDWCEENFCHIIASVPLESGGYECRLYRKEDISELIPHPGTWFQMYDCLKGGYLVKRWSLI